MANFQPPIAEISGGEHQEYSSLQTILMDGSGSVDMLLNPKTNQNLNYFWSCTSSDPNDSFCKNGNLIETGKLTMISGLNY